MGNAGKLSVMNANGLFAISSLQGGPYGYGLAARFGLNTETVFLQCKEKVLIRCKNKISEGFNLKGRPFKRIPIRTTVNSS
jgi:hypothetical protein